jgi:N-acetylglutamate synthase
MQDTDIDVVWGCEQRLTKAWPALRTVPIDGWAIRFANGYSGRANSASALAPHAMLNGALLDRIEAMYRAESMPPQVRITPLVDASASALLQARGYVIKDRAWTMIADLSQANFIGDPVVKLLNEPNQEWLEGISSRQEPSKRNPHHLLAIVGQIKEPVAFATLMQGATARGFGLSAAVDGWAEIGSVMIDEPHRGKGYGLSLMKTLLAWAKTTDATRAFLQVDITNAAALALYRKLGFENAYHYETWRLT